MRVGDKLINRNINTNFTYLLKHVLNKKIRNV